MVEDFYTVSIVFIQTVVSPNPYKSFTILKEAICSTVGKAIRNCEVLKLEIVRLRVETENYGKLKYDIYSKLKTAINKRQQEVLDFIQKNEPAQIGDIEKTLEKYSRNTLKKDLTYLVQEGLLLKTGDRRGTRYHIREIR